MIHRVFWTILSVLAFFSGGLHANLRAPYHRWFYSPGFFTGRISVVVEKETLRIDCDAPYEGDVSEVISLVRFCRVEAIYSVKSSGAERSRVEFILPGKSRVKLESGPSPGGVFTPGSSEEKEARPGPAGLSGIFPGRADETWNPDSDVQQLFVADFPLTLNAGENQIRVTYTSPVSTDEIEYGYFTTSRWLSSLTYELWPIREWTLSKDFFIDLRVSIERDSSLFPGLFGRAMEIRLFGSAKNGNTEQALATKCEQADNRYFCQTELHGFPDRLHVRMGRQRDLRSRNPGNR